MFKMQNAFFVFEMLSVQRNNMPKAPGQTDADKSCYGAADN